MKKVAKYNKKLISILLSFALLVGSFVQFVPVVNAAGIDMTRRLHNGSFETPAIASGKTFYQFKTREFGEENHWKTTAYNTNGSDGKIELFRENYGVYIPRVTLTPTDGSQAAELNADEESSLYQVVNTVPGSAYVWGLDHRGRTGNDSMALIIGPNQENSPSKNWGHGYGAGGSSANQPLSEGYKYGRDQMMQMVDWLKSNDVIISSDFTPGNDRRLTLYSKPFGEKGSFLNNEDGQPFSMTPSDVYTEEWHIWIMTSSNDRWYSYGANNPVTSMINAYGNINLEDVQQDSFYHVPIGQTKTLFSFVSVDSAGMQTNKNPTLGNLIDNVNFDIYNSVSTTASAHGNVVISSSDMVNVISNNDVTSTNPIDIFVLDGGTQHLTAKIPDGSADSTGFAGVHLTKEIIENGISRTETEFISLKDNEKDISEAQSITNWQLQSTDKRGTKTYISASGWIKHEDMEGNVSYCFPGKWLKQTANDGSISYTYPLTEITYSFQAHFVFLKQPTITYDTNGGKPYITTQGGEIYDFKPEMNSNKQFVYIEPSVSHTPQGQSNAWVFTGWHVFDDTGLVKSASDAPLLLDGENIIAADYSHSHALNDKTQHFQIIDKNGSFTGSETTDGKTWSTTSPLLYDKTVSGLTLVAQWRWRNAFIPQILKGDSYINSALGGEVALVNSSGDEILGNEYYNQSYTSDGGKSYLTSSDERILLKATPKPGYIFKGWYEQQMDSEGNISDVELSTKPEYYYSATRAMLKGYSSDINSVKTLYARFEPQLVQSFKRQLKNTGGQILETTDDSVGTLTSYRSVSLTGRQVVSKATPGEGYKFLGWYDESGNLVETIDNTLIYNVSSVKTYYARFQQANTVSFMVETERNDGSFDKNEAYGGLIRIGNTSFSNRADFSFFDNDEVSIESSFRTNYRFAGWYDESGKNLNPSGTGAFRTFTLNNNDHGKTYYARFELTKYTIKFISQTKNSSGKYLEDTSGGTVETGSVNSYINTDSSCKATPNPGYKFSGWYNQNNELYSSNPKITVRATKNETYYARFDSIPCNPITYLVSERFLPDTDILNMPISEYLYEGDTLPNGNIPTTNSDTFTVDGETWKGLWRFTDWQTYPNDSITIWPGYENGFIFNSGASTYTDTSMPNYALYRIGQWYFEPYTYQIKFDLGDEGVGTPNNHLKYEGDYYTENGGISSADDITWESYNLIDKSNYGEIRGRSFALHDHSDTAPEGKYLAGWCKSDSRDKIDFLNKQVVTDADFNLEAGDNKTVTLYAVYKDQTAVVINFDANSKMGLTTLKNGSFTVSGNQVIGSDLISEAQANPGYNFVGWSLNDTIVSTDKTLTITSAGVTPPQNEEPSVTYTYTAEFEPVTFKVAFYENAGDANKILKEQKFTYGISKNLEPLNIKREGYEFVGWATALNKETMGYPDYYPTSFFGTELNYYDENGSSQTLTNDCIIPLYAVWWPSTSKYTVEHYLKNLSDEGYTLIDSDTIYSFTDNTIPDYSELKLISGNYVYSNGERNYDTVKGDSTSLVKLYYNRASFNVTWLDEDEITLLNSKTYLYEETPDSSLTPTKDCDDKFSYTFTGWRPILGNDNDASLNHNPIRFDTTYVAVYSAVPRSYEVSYTYIDNGEGIPADAPAPPSPVSIAFGNKNNRIASEPKLTGHTFSGWATKDAFISNGAFAMPAKNVAFTGSWKKNHYWIRFDANHGNGSMTNQEFIHGISQQLNANTFTRNGYTFLGWSTSANGTVVYTNQQSVINPAEIDSQLVTLYAVWEEKSNNNNSRPKSIFVINKDVGNSSMTLQNSKVGLYKLENGVEKQIATYTFDKEGRIEIKLPDNGEYFIKQLIPPAGYMLNPSIIEISKNSSGALLSLSNSRANIPDLLNGIEHFAYIHGYEDKTVRPDCNITRAEIASIFFRLLKEDVRARYYSEQSIFSDVNPKAWYSTEVSTLSEMGVIQGYTDGNFHPEQAITRAEFAAMIARFSKAETAMESPFNDISMHWAKTEILQATANGWILGYEDGGFHPNSNITRAEAITIINRILLRILYSAEHISSEHMDWIDCTTDHWAYLDIAEATNAHDYDKDSNGLELWK